MKFFKMIIILSIVSFLNISNVFGKSDCEEVTGNDRGFKMIVNFGKMFFNGYNYAKKTNIEYSKSKMKKYILGICDSQPDVSTDEMFGKAADTNFDMSKFKKATVSKPKKYEFSMEKLFTNWGLDEKFKKCAIKNTPPSAISFFEKRFPIAEERREAAGKKSYGKKILIKVFYSGKDAKFMKTLFNFYEKKCD
jgi:hypothetical protein